jgi:Mn-dependent DtxR family transcriptional regulator
MRKAKEARLERIWQAVEEHPGVKAGRVARELDIPRSSVTRALPALEEEGLLLSEDEKGGLWSWRRKG